MNAHSSSGLFQGWFPIPSPGYTLFWVMPETHLDPLRLVSTWLLMEGTARDLVVLSTCWTIDEFLERVGDLEIGSWEMMTELGKRLHFLDCHSANLQLFGTPDRNKNHDLRYVVDTSATSGPGSLREVIHELWRESNPHDFLGLEFNLTDIAMDMGEREHISLFAHLLSGLKSRKGTVIGMADWYSHPETYKARMIHLADASLLWGVSSGERKAKYLLPIKRSVASSAEAFQPRVYRASGDGFQITANDETPSDMDAGITCYR